ncbi:MAG: SCO1664 family protein [Ilumatobacteraceae bacterium]
MSLLRSGEIEVLGRMPYSSNATFLVEISDATSSTRGIYKPLRGERPLWDFPPGLYKREIAAYIVSDRLGIDVVPPTVERDGPHGTGSVQLFIEARFEEHYFTLFEAQDHLHDQFRKIAAFDIVANNTDRKSGHCLIDTEDRIWAIDNGLCFSESFKLRTVIWEFGGEEIPAELLASVDALANDPPSELDSLLSPDEITAMVERSRLLVAGARFPIDASGHRYPWPMV